MNVSRRTLAKLLVAALAAAAFYVSFRETPESQVRTVITELTQVMRRKPNTTEAAWANGVQQKLTAAMAPGVSVSIPELETVEGRDAVVELAVTTRGVLELAPDFSGITLEGDRGQARLSLGITSHLGGREHRERRTATVELVREDGVFQVSAIQIGPALYEEPEPRP